MVKKQSNSSKQASLFDIRLKNDHDVLVLKGSAVDAASALLSGNIVLSVNEPLTVRKISLRLYGTIRLNYSDIIQSAKGTYTKPTKFEKKVYEYIWDPQEINKYLSNIYDNSSNAAASVGSLSRNHSSSSLKNLGHSMRSKSSGNLSHLSSLTSLHNQSSSSFNLSSNSSSTNLASAKSNHVLVQGNYEIPFSAILPGDMPESVEGLPGGSVVYKLEAVIDRGKFQKNMVAKRHVRVIRTLTTDSVELSETVAVDNTWPKKVEYSLNVPCKAIAIGSGTPISFMLVPLLKGLRLGEIKITLAELYSYVGFLPPAHSDERIVAEKIIPKPSDDDYMMDKWEVDTHLKIPPSLSKCTQDCDIQTHLKVRHKLKFVIGLVNPDGHVSELRASLPVQLFISPFVSISARQDADSTGGSNKNSTTDLSALGKHARHDDDEEVIFTSDPHSASHTSLNNLAHETTSQLGSHTNSVSSFTGLVAPPLYEKHIYDRLWSDVSPIESPLNSGTATPRNPYSARNDVQHEFSMSPVDSVLLNENLRQLSIQRQLQESEGASTPSNRATFNLDGETSSIASGHGLEVSSGDYFSRGRPILHQQPSSDGHNTGILSPQLYSPPAHLSRAPSESMLNSASLSQVPSYTQAIRGDTQDGLLSPAYEPPLPGSNIDLNEANRNFEEHKASSTPGSLSSGLRGKLLSRGSSSINIRNALSSNGSSPSNSRNVSYTNLSNGHSTTSPVNISRSSSRAESINNVNTPNVLSKPGSGSSIVPLSTSPNSFASKSHELPSSLLSAQLHGQPVAQPSSSASDRSAAILGPNAGPIKSSSSLSLHNLHFLNKKKDKK